MEKITTLILATLLLAPLTALHAEPKPEAENLARGFVHPPDSARPWVYWFWNNANVTREGITADLEAMQRVGIGGVLIQDVVEKPAPPQGVAAYMGPHWMELYQVVLGEAARLGLEVNLNNGPGWCGSSDKEITPELSMQVLVKTDTPVNGPGHFDGILPVAEKKLFYHDVAVLAFPDPVKGVVPRDQVVDLTARMAGDARLSWDVPAGKWVVQRIGATSTGMTTRPPVIGGNGLECDKLSKEAMDLHFVNVMKRLIATAGPLAGKTLVATHIDSWEVGGQNWTPKLREEFQKRRGYDPLTFLPVVAGNLKVGGTDIADRFRWDYSQTIAELLAENYTGRLAELAQQNGLRLTLEGYNLPFGDEATYTAPVQEPMTEFWTMKDYSNPNHPPQFGVPDTARKAHQMASVAHLYGRPVVGAEAFTSDKEEKWRLHPATIKAEGDFEFSQGVNRFVFHRYAHQPYLDRFPGVTMGHWGLHYERTQTWWEMSRPWHEYLARCQFMLRQGLFVGDLLYERPEIPNQCYFTADPPPPDGYNYDEASGQAIMERASVKGGRIVFPACPSELGERSRDGMDYRLLVLPPNQTTMTPAFLRKLKELVAAGAVISGPPPKSSPGLGNYPGCDQEVAALAKELWGDCDGKTVTRHAYGKGMVCWGQTLPEILATLQTPPDFISDHKLNWIHRHTPDAEIYFVANPGPTEVSANCSFRVPGLRPELWNPETGAMSAATVSGTYAVGVTLPIHLDPVGSVFVVFRDPRAISKQLVVPLGATKPLGAITGPWEVRFPPHWGAPEKVTFDPLISWSDSPDAGVKHFSGTATYLKTFTAEPGWFQSGPRMTLDLGDVQVMARVKLNGKDLGILWKPPYRVEVTGALKPGENRLEISVVNLWPNRMIGDAALPVEKRLTWSPWEPFKQDTPLLPSGLLGPVMLRMETWIEPK